MQEELENAVQNALTNIFEGSHFSKTEVIQNLWSGYGEIARYSQERGDNSVIVKMVDPNAGGHHPRGWNTNTSHQRKLSSYVNEQNFYRYYAGSTNRRCRVPDCLAYNTETGANWLVMEDLDRAGFEERREYASSKIVERGLEWLAHFHAIFAQSDGEHLWQIGTYWHKLEVIHDSDGKANV